MVDISDFNKKIGTFLKAEDVKANPSEKFYILEEGKIVQNKFGNERLHLSGMFNNEERTFDCSKTNSRVISDKIGSDTTKWINARLKLDTFRTQRTDGVKTDAIEVLGVEAPDEVEKSKIN